MRPVALVLFGVAAALAAAFGSVGSAAAPVPKHLMKEPDSDKSKLRGQWKVESMRMGNQELLGLVGQNFEMVLEFGDDTLTVSGNIGGMAQKTTATLAYSTGNAKQLRMTNMRTADGAGKPGAAQPDESFGYALDGDKLLLAAPQGGAKEKAAGADPLKPGSNDVVITLTRVKK